MLHGNNTVIKLLPFLFNHLTHHYSYCHSPQAFTDIKDPLMLAFHTHLIIASLHDGTLCRETMRRAWLQVLGSCGKKCAFYYKCDGNRLKVSEQRVMN